MSAPPDEISELLRSMQSCICDAKAWATAKVPKLNDNKTEIMFVTSKRTKHLHSLPTSIRRRRRRRKLYFNNLLHVHQHTSMKYMIYDTVGYWGKKSEDKYVCMRYSPMITMYITISLWVMLKFPSKSMWRIWALHKTVILLWMHMSPILLGLATLNCVVWHLFVDSRQVLQLPHLYLLLFCQELTNVSHCCLVLLMMWHPTCNGNRTMQLE